MPFLAQLFAAASYQVAWSIYVSDYSRYLPRDVGVSASFWWTYLGAFVGGSWTMLVGTVAAALYPKLEFATAVRAAADAVIPGFGKPLLLCSLLGLVTITTLNFYGASLTLLSVVDSLKPSRLDARQAGAHPDDLDGRRDRHRARLDARTSWKNSANFSPCFSTCSRPGRRSTWWISTGCAGATIRCARYSTRAACTGAGIGAACRRMPSGFVAMMPFFSVNGLYVGPVAAALGGADVAMLVGLPVATVVYLWACRSLDVEADRRRAAAADVGLDPGAT